jgi:L-iditol 2-dehydrogenase
MPTPTAHPVVTARSVLLDADGELQLREVAVPPPGPGQIRLRITACGVCPAESAGWSARRLRNNSPGHEPAGVVESLGPGVEHLRAGMRVFAHHHAPCGTCGACRRGRPVHCATWRRNALTPGAMSEYVLVSAEAVAADVLPLPESVPDAAATLIEPLACVLRAWSRALGPDRSAAEGPPGPESVLVMGLGVMGMLHCAAARARGADEVIAADRVPHRLTRALEFGATETVNVEVEDLAARTADHTGGRGADLVIVGPGSAEAMELGSACVAPGGTLLLFSPPPVGQRWGMPVGELFHREVRVITSFSAGPDDTRAALAALAGPLQGAGRRLVTHRFPLDRVHEAFRLAAASAEALQVVVEP